MSLIKNFSGRKRESAVWDFFKIDEGNDRSVCQVAKKDKICGKPLHGKNSTNATANLKRSHPDEFSSYESKEKEKEVLKNKMRLKRALDEGSSANPVSSSTKKPTLGSFIHKHCEP